MKKKHTKMYKLMIYIALIVCTHTQTSCAKSTKNSTENETYIENNGGNDLENDLKKYNEPQTVKFANDSLSFPYKDSLQFSILKCTPDNKSENMMGFTISFSDKLSKWHEFYIKKNLLSFYVTFKVYDSNGKYIYTINQKSYYKDESQHVTYIQSISDNKSSAKFHIPYYIMDLPEGKHNLIVQAYVYMHLRNGSEDIVLTPKINGKTQIAFGINKPKTYQFTVSVPSLTVSSKNKNGNYWDLFQPDPDLRWTIEVLSDYGTDVLYSSSQVKESYSGFWDTNTVALTISVGDRPRIAVYDVDVAFDDIIGSKTFDIEQLEQYKLVNGETILDFGFVEKLSLVVK